MTVIYMPQGTQDYSMRDECQRVLERLLQLASDQIPDEFGKHINDVTFSTSTDSNVVYFPCPFKETEAASGLKAIEGIVAAAIADLRYPSTKSRKIDVNLERATCALFAAYLSTVDGMDKTHPAVRTKLKG